MIHIRGKYIAILTSAVILLALIFSPIYTSSTVDNVDEEVKSLSDGPWPSFGRDMSNTRISPYDTEHVDGTVNWTLDTENAIRSSPAIGSNGVMYLGTIDGKLTAIDVEDGELKWTFCTDDVIISSPAVSEDEIIYFGSGDHNIYALNHDGSLRWKYETDGVVYSSPTVDEDGNVYIGSYDGNLYSIDKDGELNWKFSSDSWLWSSPSVSGDDIVYVGSGDTNLYAIDRIEGTKLWNFTTGGFIYSSPAITEDNIYFGSYDGNLYSLDKNGDLIWIYDCGIEIHSSPAVGEDGTIYIGARDGRLYAVNEGIEKWFFETGNRIDSSPALSSDGNIYVGSYDYNFYSLDSNGELVWSFETKDSIYSSPAIGENGNIFAASLDGSIYSFTGSENLPDLNIDIWREVEISVRISGRINNGVNIVLERNDEEIINVELVREPGKPQIETVTIPYYEANNYTLYLEYIAEHKGANPVWIEFSSGNRSEKIFENFNYNFEREHEKSYNLNDEISQMISKVREIHFSVEGEIDESMILSAEWNFGDGNLNEGLYVVHEYSSPGRYEITLQLYFEDNRIMTLEDVVIIEPHQNDGFRNRNTLRTTTLRSSRNRCYQQLLR